MRQALNSVPDIKTIFPVLLPVTLWTLLFLGIGGGATSNVWDTGGPLYFFNGIRGVVPFVVAGSTAVFVVYRVLQGYIPKRNIFGPLGLATVYGVVGFIAAFNSPDGSVALWWAGLYLSVPIVLWGVVWSTEPLEQIRTLIKATWLAVILAAGVLLLLGVFKLDFIDRILDPSQFLECRQTYWYDLTSGRIRGTGVGRYAAIAGLIALSGMWQPKWRTLWTGMLVISVLLLLYSGARGSFVGFGAGAAMITLIYLVTSGRRTLAIGLLITASVAGVVWTTGALDTFFEECIARNVAAAPDEVVAGPVSQLFVRMGPDIPDVPVPPGAPRTSLGPDIIGDYPVALAVESAPFTGEQPDSAAIAAKAEQELIVSNFFSFTGRRAVWRDGWGLFKDSPVIGYGFHADRLLLGAHMHNSVMHAMLQSGLLGTVPFILAIVITWILLLRIVLRIGSLAASDKHIVIQCGGILAFFSMRSFPESTGAFFGVDWLILAVLLFYIQAVNFKVATPGIKTD